ncbi:DUF3943 domain-containing protein [Haliangium ochraceum]|uniref:DUF3943 domain-containing protein n=1 Tax=Haliangium ochraceum (strain DSM 14365 / JCM 11303 / SMP-2) TaxID=502025 RepID=D0LJR4_HALO1|nr:DUF3943 domain-containing protein [Haliangium ochraceum]ACY18421.1 hypothetical protein Hoch_5946 [Haliangium ochraceum DSM 14365]
MRVAHRFTAPAPALAPSLASSLALVAALAVLALAAPVHAQEAAPAPEPVAADSTAKATAPMASEAPCQLLAPGCFLDRMDENADSGGRLRDAEQAYARLHQRPRPQRLRAALEMGTLLGIGTAWYWIDRTRQVADWDFPSIKQRFTGEAIRLDNNDFWINFIAHPLDGAAAHALSRANHLSLAESFGFGLGTSLAWEYGLEFREKISINDIIVTPVTGVVVGEFMHRLGQSLGAARPPGTRRWYHELARWGLGPTVAIHDALDAPGADASPAERTAWAQRMAARRDIWRSLRISYGLSFEHQAPAGASPALALRFDGRLVTIPGFLAPGRFSRWFFDADLAALRLDLGLGLGLGAGPRADTGTRGSGVDLYGDTVLVGWYGQRIPAASVGAAAAVGVGLGYRYADETYAPWRDQLGIAHLPGLAVDAFLVGGGARLRAYARVHGDFAGLHAAPFRAWEAANPDALTKSILRKQGYYYGWGLSGRLGLAIESDALSLGGEVFYGSYDSQEGLDRIQDELSEDVRVDSRVRDAEAWLRLALPASLHAELAVLERYRDTRVEEFRASARLRRYLVRIGAAF